jgi:Fur family transcriptional regulator, ferric uptake regulator
MERATRQRAAIRAAIEKARRPLSPAEILTLAQQEVAQLSLATVYRSLNAMQEEGEITAVNLPGENTRYETTQLGHHHHFRCLKCERVFDIHGCAGDALHIAPKGFVVERHELTLYGSCAECSQPGNRSTHAQTPSDRHSHKH